MKTSREVEVKIFRKKKLHDKEGKDLFRKTKKTLIKIYNIHYIHCLTNDCKGLEISHESVYDGVSFNKAVILQCSDCNFAIEITHYRYFFENVPNTSCLKKPYFEKKVYGGPAS